MVTTEHAPTESASIDASWLRAAGWAVLVSLFGLLWGWTFGILWISGTATDVTGPLSEVASMIIGASLLYAAWILHDLYGPNYPQISLGVLIVGILGAVISFVGGLLLFLDQVGLELGSAGPLLTISRIGTLVLGLWIVAISAVEFTDRHFDRRVPLAGFVAGLGSVVAGAALLLGGTSHPAFGIGSLIQVVGWIFWTVWLGRRLLANNTRVETETPEQGAAV